MHTNISVLRISNDTKKQHYVRFEFMYTNCEQSINKTSFASKHPQTSREEHTHMHKHSNHFTNFQSTNRGVNLSYRSKLYLKYITLIFLERTKIYVSFCGYFCGVIFSHGLYSILESVDLKVFELQFIDLNKKYYRINIKCFIKI